MSLITPLIAYARIRDLLPTLLHPPATAVRQLIDEVVADYAERRLVASMPPLADAGQVAKAVADGVIGMGPLQPFFEDPDVEEIWINEPGKVLVPRPAVPS